MPTHSSAERAALADALTAAGPHRPTLCDGWTTTELAAHLVTRERRPDVTVSGMLPGLSGWGRRIQDKYAAQPYADLISAIRTGPPRTSPFALPGVDKRVNLIEHFVHCEDVRRAYTGDPGWTPRELPASRQTAFWAQLSVIGKLMFRRSPVTVGLRTPDGRTTTLHEQAGAERVDLVGEPAELVLYTYGRKDQAQVQLEGPDEAVATFRELPLKA